MAWVVLVAAGFLEVAWAACLKASRGFTRPWPTAGFGVFLFASMAGLGLALRAIPLGTAYTVWTGIGALGTVLLGILVLGESADLRRLACIGLILAGVIGLKIVSPE